MCIFLTYSVRRGCTCVNVTSTVQPDNVLRITAACSINPHIMTGVGHIAGLFGGSAHTAIPFRSSTAVKAVSPVATCMNPVGRLALRHMSPCY